MERIAKLKFSDIKLIPIYYNKSKFSRRDNRYKFIVNDVEYRFTCDIMLALFLESMLVNDNEIFFIDVYLHHNKGTYSFETKNNKIKTKNYDYYEIKGINKDKIFDEFNKVKKEEVIIVEQ